MLFTYGVQENRTVMWQQVTALILSYDFVTYHQLEEKPSLLQGALPDTSTAHHPLKGQLLVEELSVEVVHKKTEVEMERQAGEEKLESNGTRQKTTEEPEKVSVSQL